MNPVEFLSSGSDCSPAAALRSLGYRNTAFPFDWVDSSVSAVISCLEDDFNQYHTNLTCIGSRMVDTYGFQFPHDYPFSNCDYDKDSISEWRTHEDVGGKIVNNWKDYYPEVKEKYDRRIQRFRDIGISANPIIVLMRRPISHALQIRDALVKYYNRRDIFLVVATPETYESDVIVTCLPEIYGDWNNKDIWSTAINCVLQKIACK